MHTFKVSELGYIALTQFLEQIWSFGELQRNPRMYIMDDCRWQIRLSRNLER